MRQFFAVRERLTGLDGQFSALQKTPYDVTVSVSAQIAIEFRNFLETVTPVLGEDPHPAYNVKCSGNRGTLRDSRSNRLKLLSQSIPRVAVSPRPHNHAVVPI